MINLEQKGKDVVPDMMRRFLPDKETAGIKKGQVDCYRQPWMQYPAGNALGNKS
jgi:hypothetical protein